MLRSTLKPRRSRLSSATQLLRLPNLPSEDAPDGASEDDNVVVRTVGYEPGRYAPYQRVPHWEVGAELGILDLERGAKISGSMFPLFQGGGATLVRALCQLALDLNSDAYTEIRPPTLVRTPVLEAVGQLPKFADDAYHLERDDLWGIPTGEVPLTFMRAGEILAEENLPLRLMAYTPCYRREAGAAGRDTRGLLRVHEFDKVEILAICTRAQAPALHEGDPAACTAPHGGAWPAPPGRGHQHRGPGAVARPPVRHPGLRPRVRHVAGGFLGVLVQRLPSSPSGHPLQASRRGPNQHCDTLNGSALAVPAVWAALVETYRQADGSVEIPACLHPYFRGATSIAAAGKGT